MKFLVNTRVEKSEWPVDGGVHLQIRQKMLVGCFIAEEQVYPEKKKQNSASTDIGRFFK